MSTLILCFHRIADPLFGGRSKLAISEKDFKSVLDEVGRSYDFVALSDLPKNSRTKRAVVTFDDGYADNFYTALPILESRGISSTFFLSTGFIDKQVLFPPDALDALFSDSDGPSHLASPLLSEQRSYWPALEALVTSKETMFWSALAEISGKYWDAVVAQDPLRRPITEREAKELARHPLTALGPHTLSHRRLSSLPLSEAWNEIRDSLERIRTLDGQVVPYLAYPFGQPRDVSSAVSAQARELELTPLTTFPVLVNTVTKKRFHSLGVPRLSIGPAEVPLISFLARLLPLVSRFPRSWLASLAARRRFAASPREP